MIKPCAFYGCMRVCEDRVIFLSYIHSLVRAMDYGFNCFQSDRGGKSNSLNKCYVNTVYVYGFWSVYVDKKDSK